MKAHHHRRVCQEAFSLLNWLTIISVIVLLYVLLTNGFTICEVSAARSHSNMVIKAARSGLEVCQQKFGAYPEAANPNVTVTIDGKNWLVGEAACLYQALSGDGSDQIKDAKDGSAPASDGVVDVNEAKNITLENIPKEMWAQTNGIYYIVDGFGHPIRYIAASPAGSPAPGQPSPAPTTANSDYDLWSYGDDETNITATSLQASGGSGGSRLDAKWIKNW